MRVPHLASTTSKHYYYYTLRNLTIVKTPLPRHQGYPKEAIKHLIETPQNEWNVSKLNNLQYPPTTLFHITHNLALNSSCKALSFFEFLQRNSPLLQENSLPSAFRALLDIASRDSKGLEELYREMKARKLSLFDNVAAQLIRGFGRAGLVDKAIIVYEDMEHSAKTANARNALVDVLFAAGRYGDGLKVLDEMLEQGSVCQPNDVTWKIVSRALMKKDWGGGRPSFYEVVELVLKFGKHGVFPSSSWITQFCTNLCRNGEIGKAWDLLRGLMDLGARLVAASCNVVLTKLGKFGDSDEFYDLMVKMKENGIEPDGETFGIVIDHLCKSRSVDEALEVFERLSEVSVQPDAIMYNALIDGLCKAKELFDEMLKSGCSTDDSVHYSLISGLTSTAKGNVACFDFSKSKEFTQLGAAWEWIPYIWVLRYLSPEPMADSRPGI
ncbi:hypothetical protein ACFE04_012989 [Oxalis oulophora]